MNEIQENKQGKLIQDLTNIHAGQYLSLVDDGSFKIVQVQESNVNDSYTLEPVDIENINLDLSDNYDLLQTLVENATSEKLDLSALIIEWLKQYPTVVKSAQTQADTITQNDATIKDLTAKNQELTEQNQELEKEINDLTAKNQELTEQNQEVEKEINDLQTKKDNPTTNQPTSSDSSKNDTQTGNSNTNDQVQAGSDKTSEKASDEVPDQNKNVGANNEQ